MAVVAALAIALGGASSAAAQWVVTDPGNTVQSAIAATNSGLQLKQMIEQSAKQLEQIQLAIEQRDALRGARGLSELLNGPEEQAARREFPAKFDQLLDLAEGWERERQRWENRRAGGSETSADVAQILGGVLTGLDLPGADGVYPSDPRGPTARSYERERNAAASAFAVAQKAYDDAARRLDTYEVLMTQIDRSEDLKASIDLQNRIAIENGLTALESIRVAAAATAARAAETMSELVSGTEQVRRMEPVQVVPIGELARIAEEQIRELRAERRREERP